MAIEIDNKKMWETAIRLYRQITGHSEAFDKALEDMGLCYKDGEITTIEPKVEWYMCIKESAGFKAGHIYKCNGGRFVNDLGVMFTAGYWGDYFRPATEEEVMKYSYKDKPNYPLMPSECTTIEPEVKWYVALNDYGHYDNIIFDAVPIFLKGERTTKENVFNMCKNIMGYEITEEEFNKNFRPATEEEIQQTSTKPYDPEHQGAYTTIEQSRKLAEILPLESADMWYHGHSSPLESEREYDNDACPFHSMSPNWDKPSWSLAALLGVLPNGTRLLKSTNISSIGDVKYYCDCPKLNIDKWFDNPVDACYEMILKLNELKIL